MTRDEFDDMNAWIAQAAINIAEQRYCNFEYGCRVHRALERYCEAVVSGEIYLSCHQRQQHSTEKPSKSEP